MFIPIGERYSESDKLVFGADGEGSGGNEYVVEVLTRGADGSGRRRGVERALEGWAGGGPCQLNWLSSLKPLLTRRSAEEVLGFSLKIWQLDAFSDVREHRVLPIQRRISPSI